MALDEYINPVTGQAKIKTAKDLIKLGVIPKTSNQHIGIIAIKTLEALRDKISAGLDDNVLGIWLPLVEEKEKDIGKTEINDPDDIVKYGKPGMKVMVEAQQGKDGKQRKLEGVIKTYKPRTGKFGVEFAENIAGNDLDGLCKQGYGYWIGSSDLKLLVPNKKVSEGFTLNDSAVANKDAALSHKLMFSEKYSGNVLNEGRYETQVEIPKGTTGRLIEYDKKNQTVLIAPEGELAKSLKTFAVSLEDIANAVQVSSLGAMEPQEREKVVFKETLSQFFPTAKLETERANREIVGIIMPRFSHLIMYGPPGSGKTTVVNDIIKIAKKQKYVFTVKRPNGSVCRCQCNPASLYDYEGFGKIVPPCPECMIAFSKENGFAETGRFHSVKPEDIEVVVAELGDGRGMEIVQGKRRVSTRDLMGFKMPNPDGKEVSMTSEYDPSGVDIGAFIKANNGFCGFEEIEKASLALEDMLDPLSRQKVKIEGTRLQYPANFVLLGTVNDPSLIPEALIDRVFMLRIPYSEDVKTNKKITAAGYYGETSPVEELDIGDTHKDRPISLLDEVPMPVILENALEAMYIKFRTEYKGKGKLKISGGNRSKFDAFDAARVQLLIDKIFFSDTPQTVNPQYAIAGMQFALCCRVNEKEEKVGQEAKNELRKWVEDNFTDVYKKENNTWWCEFNKYLAVTETQVPEIKGNFIQEFLRYKQDPAYAAETFERVKAAYEDKSKDPEKKRAKVEFPFMDHLFKEQKRIQNIGPEQLEEMITFYVQSRENSDCNTEGGENKIP